MRLLLDQMLDVEVARQLASAGYDVVRVADVGLSRADDRDILQRSIKDNRILVTLDEHFGNWAVLPLDEHPGVIRVKASPSTTKRILGVLLPFLEQHGDRTFGSKLVIVRKSLIRWIDTSN